MSLCDTSHQHLPAEHASKWPELLCKNLWPHVANTYFFRSYLKKTKSQLRALVQPCSTKTQRWASWWPPCDKHPSAAPSQSLSLLAGSDAIACSPVPCGKHSPAARKNCCCSATSGRLRGDTRTSGDRGTAAAVWHSGSLWNDNPLARSFHDQKTSETSRREEEGGKRSLQGIKPSKNPAEQPGSLPSAGRVSLADLSCAHLSGSSQPFLWWLQTSGEYSEDAVLLAIVISLKSFGGMVTSFHLFLFHTCVQALREFHCIIQWQSQVTAISAALLNPRAPRWLTQISGHKLLQGI